ncbi:hypothetical protein [Vibrio maritimus]|uniref:hypothetical protein n=1 Tax=Vibrio maritimus TaxID=990268 RepID=UPI001F30713D|nr:hypothetical protein [Vibrio maritimus]
MSSLSSVTFGGASSPSETLKVEFDDTWHYGATDIASHKPTVAFSLDSHDAIRLIDVYITQRTPTSSPGKLMTLSWFCINTSSGSSDAIGFMEVEASQVCKQVYRQTIFCPKGADRIEFSVQDLTNGVDIGVRIHHEVRFYESSS